MKMLHVVFVNEKPVWEKKFQENSSKNTRVQKKLIIWGDFTQFKSSHRRCSVKKSLQMSQENTYVGVFFNKIASAQAYNYIKRRLY